MTKVKANGTKRSRTLRLLYYWGKIVGLVPLTLSENNEMTFSYLSLFYGCFLCVPYAYLIYHVLFERFTLILPGDTPISVIVDFIAVLGGGLEILLMWLIFAFYQNRIKHIVTSFGKAESISKELGIPEDYEKHFRKLGIYLITVYIIYAVWKLINNGAMGAFTDAPVLLWTFFMVPRVQSFTTWTIFIWSHMIVRRKFRRLNDKVRLLMNNETIAECLRISRADGIFSSHKFDFICQLHRALRDVIYRIEDHFALIILLNILTQFANITMNVHVLYHYIKFCGASKATDFLYMFVIACWIFIPVIVLAILSDVCGSTVEEANETGNILHAMLNNYEYSNNTEATTLSFFNVWQIHLLSLELLQNPVKISLFGFFDLNSFMVYSSIATATTHLTIMLQFYS